jgi:hypothetical protein
MAVNWGLPRIERNLYQLLAVTGAVGIVSILVTVVISNSQVYEDFIKNQIESMLNVLKQSMTQTTGASSAFLQGFLTTERVYNLVKEVVLRDYLFVYFLVLAGNWRLGTVIGRRTLSRETWSYAGFSLPEIFVWPLLLSWTGILVDAFVGLGFLRYIFWNLGLIFLLLYGLQGGAIIKFLFIKYNVARNIRLLIIMGTVVFLFIPGINFLIIIGIPGLGVSELWIKYRKEERSE